MFKEYKKENLGEEKFFYFFNEISKIPRRPGSEGKIADYLVKFATKRNLEYYRDKYNNVIIWKKASKGYEYKEILGLQNHTDMVCEKTVDSTHNFDKDGLQLYVDGDFVKAQNTTLGADNGVGVAYVLAILDDKKILSPELECIFTVEEETTMNGSRFLDVNKLRSKRIISFDSFYEDIMVVNSASCKEWSSDITIQRESVNDNYKKYKLELKKFPGGHSGLDIDDKKRGNPIKLAFNLISVFNEIYIDKLKGGSRVSIIPRDMSMEFCINNNEISKIKSLLSKIEEIKRYYSPEVKITLQELDSAKNSYINKRVSKKIINFVEEFENGTLKYDDEGQVILSANLGVIEQIEDRVIFRYSVRSNERELGINKMKDFNNLITKYGIKNFEFDEMKAFEPIENSELIEKCSNIYYDTFKSNIKKIKSQTCLEIGFLAEKIKDLEYIAVAPNIYNAHSPDEKFSISSSKKFWKYIENILKFL